MLVVSPPIELVEFTRVYLAVFYTLVALFYTTRIISIKRSTASEIVFPGERFGSTWWNHFAFRLFRVLIWLVCVSRLVFPTIDNYLGMIDSLETTLTMLLGHILLLGGFMATISIHIRLGQKWRSGIDPTGPKTIISTGIYRFSRNPMFVCIAASQFGFFLVLPSLFTLICFVVGIYTLHSQTLEEEKHLSALFPAEYESYLTQVRRWV